MKTENAGDLDGPNLSARWLTASSQSFVFADLRFSKHTLSSRVSLMSTGLERPLVAELRHGLIALRGDWFWFVLLGVALIIVGCIALSSVVVASLATAMAIGILLLLGGIAEMVGAFWCRGWSGFFLHLLSGVLSVVVGLLFLRRRSVPCSRSRSSRRASC